MKSILRLSKTEIITVDYVYTQFFLIGTVTAYSVVGTILAQKEIAQTYSRKNNKLQIYGFL